ncbi:hypothetical protein F0L74_21710 [Chitinophaga agrisoli]|uniref:Uncharacterized protein n=1 Tax=Chitinophaga agrisoli TaxID=2607653 RepID=A0A5B2VIU9_9BACT|nr:hypothetical protein [Chitinophaga agrisoli]KAA2238834.1 hypothetical protein F0L74_21710 [Chitinophaga agrisoli]
MDTHQVTIPYKGINYDVTVTLSHETGDCRIMAHVAGHDILFLSTEDDCLHAVYEENIIDSGLIEEISRHICKACL